MIDLLCNGYRVEIGLGSVVIIQIHTGDMMAFNTVAEAYAWVKR